MEKWGNRQKHIVSSLLVMFGFCNFTRDDLMKSLSPCLEEKSWTNISQTKSFTWANHKGERNGEKMRVWVRDIDILVYVNQYYCRSPPFPLTVRCTPPAPPTTHRTHYYPSRIKHTQRETEWALQKMSDSANMTYSLRDYPPS